VYSGVVNMELELKWKQDSKVERETQTDYWQEAKR
jgi:hypothetical protein